MINDSSYYDFLKKKRGVKNLVHFPTPFMYNPGLAARILTTTTPHIWSFGDHFYKLAHEYYQDSRFWWVIAWYNGYPTEADIKIGALIEIPSDLEEGLRVLGM